MKTAPAWIKEGTLHNRENHIDLHSSQYMCMVLESFDKETDEIRKALQHYTGRVIIQWIPGHISPTINWLTRQQNRQGYH